MKKFIIFLLAAFPIILFAQPSKRSIAFTHVNVIDVKSGEIKKDISVIISGDRITAVGKKVSVPKNTLVINAAGKYLIPGLWDMHVHLFNNSSRTGTDNHENYFPLLIANGITGVRDMWTDPEDIKVAQSWIREMDSGKLISPRVAVGSSIVDGTPPFIKNSYAVSTPEEARQAVRMLKDAGSGFIKVYWNLSPEQYYAIADESKKLGIDFAGHVPFSMSAAACSDAGQKSIEHLTGIAEGCSSREEELRKEKQKRAVAEDLLKTYDESKCMALYRRFAKNKTWHTPTVILHMRRTFGDQTETSKDQRLKYAYKSEVEDWLKLLANRRDPVSVDIRKQRYQQILDAIGNMHGVGVPLLAGSDLGNPFIMAGFSLHDELVQFVRSGLTPFEALKTATINPAKFLSREKELGTIQKGKLADMVLLDANPLDDIHNTRRINAVVANGKYFSRKDLDKLLADVEALVKNK